MKTNNNPQNNNNVLSLDDIIFAGRNQTYGAYYLRKNYNKFLIRSFLSTFTLVATIFVISIFNRSTVIPLIGIGATPIEPIPYYPTPTVLPPQVLSGPSQSLINRLILYHPVIVDEVTVNSPRLFTNEDINLGESSNESTNGSGISGFPISGGNGNGSIIPDDTIFILPPEEPAAFNGDFRKWVAKHVTYPEEIQHMEIQGKVSFQFVVNKQGYTEDINILRGVDPSLDQEVINVIKNSPKWTPGKQGGTPVKQKFTMQIYFKLER